MSRNQTAKKLMKQLADYQKTPECVGYDLRLDLSTIICDHLGKTKSAHKALARKAGISEVVLSRLIHSTSNCTFDTAGKVLFAMGLKGELICMPCQKKQALLLQGLAGAGMTRDGPRRRGREMR